MSNIEQLGDTIVPKSDQLNADDLITGPITVTVKDVKRGDTQEQPVSVVIDGGRQPYKPCKSMRRVLIGLWGENGKAWIGRSMTLYCDPSVKFGGVQVGGIRISHMSHITGRKSLMLTTTRSNRSEYIVLPLEVAPPIDVSGYLKAIADAKTEDEIIKVYKSAPKEAKDAIKQACADRKSKLNQPKEQQNGISE